MPRFIPELVGIFTLVAGVMVLINGTQFGIIGFYFSPVYVIFCLGPIYAIGMSIDQLYFKYDNLSMLFVDLRTS